MLKCSHLYVFEDSRQSQADKIISVHLEILLCHSEPFDQTCRRAQVESLRAGSAKEATLCQPGPFVILRINSTKDLEILRRPAFSGTPQIDHRKEGFADGH